MSSTMRIFPSVENPTTSKKHKNKKKKEKKDKNKTNDMPKSQYPNSCLEMPSTPKKTKKKKKAKKKTKSDKCIQPPNVQKQQHQIQPIVGISHNQEAQQPIKNKGQKQKIKHTGKIKKRVIFNLPPEQEQINDNIFAMKQFVAESSLESSTAEEMSSQDMFITQKSFLDAVVEISSSSSDNQTITMKTPDNSSYKSTSEATTQTENFFTFPALSTSFRFRQQQNTSNWEEPPMDLSLPGRTRQKQSTTSSENVIKISDPSSEEGEMASKSKVDLFQLKVIQTRLNESFFFRVKGEDSPKPLCPLMKLTESVEKRAKM